ncbi:proteasome complex subunit Rpn13 ubiquitin receptor-domain-containing protein [Absidia repens]|uniref:Proteasome complex subunit Rpn13 ubiquitin receptor-domain-containing protein n=1 Tax=Absidia repens TaxID=90262 RepID=A0A1X2J273_9FUNG|nr:proteasome complex subunit Rpn13 ubiquitin receptor-domain-containing protein [Absidia repens]
MNLYQQPERHLVQFNAGKCIREGNMLKPDLRKGMIYMDQGNDQLMHFYWKERKYNSEPEDDLIIFPDEAELQKVPECTTGRVLVLKYKTSNQRLFFWMQKLDSDLDDTVIQRVNQLINDPSSALDDTQMDLDSSDHSIEMELMQRLMGSAGEGNLTEENLMELFQQAGSLR